MRTPQQRRNLIKLRDEVVKFIPDNGLRMSRFFYTCGTPSCVLGYATDSGEFPMLEKIAGEVTGHPETFGEGCWNHIFSTDLPNDPSWIAANITDLIEADA